MTFRKAIYWALIALFAIYVVREWETLKEVGSILVSGIWYWMVLAILLQAVHFMLHSTALREGMGSVGIDRKRRDMIPVILASLAVNVAAPTMNVSGAAFTVEEARKKGFPPVSALAGMIITVLSDGIVFLLGSFLVVFLLFWNQELTPSVLLGVLIFASIVLALTGLAFLFWKKPQTLSWIFRIAGKEREKSWKAEWEKFVGTAFPLHKIRNVFGYEVLSHSVKVLSLGVVFLAFNSDPASLVLITTYIVSVLFVILSPTPMGIGFAEGGMILTMVGFGMPQSEATAIAIAFRGISFWIPLLIGSLYLHKMRETVVTSHKA